MKMIDELADAYVRARASQDGYDCEDVRTAYLAGAEDERKELTKWNNPKDKLPPDDREVLCMIDCCYNTYLILKHNDLGWWMLASNGGRCVCAFEVIGWREIPE